jgi:predicted GIY-YIG superfamily endonuclease
MYGARPHEPDTLTGNTAEETTERIRGVLAMCDFMHEWLDHATRDARFAQHLGGTIRSHVPDYVLPQGMGGETHLDTLLLMIQELVRDTTWLARTARNIVDEYDKQVRIHELSARNHKWRAEEAERQTAQLLLHLGEPRQLDALRPNDLLEPHVYIFRAADGQPLYVGQSTNVLSRLAQHRKRDFYEQADRIELIQCATWQDMQALERTLIKKLNPTHNVVGKVAS